MHMKIVTSMFLPTFSYPATILLIPSCGIWNTDTAKKPRGKLFHENMQYTLSSSKQLQIHIENPHSSSEDRKETGSIPFSVMLCFSCSKIQNFLNYFEFGSPFPFRKLGIKKKKKSLKDNMKVSFQATWNVHYTKSLHHNSIQRAWDESKGDKVCKYKHRVVPYGPHPSFTAPFPTCAAWISLSLVKLCLRIFWAEHVDCFSSHKKWAHFFITFAHRQMKCLFICNSIIKKPKLEFALLLLSCLCMLVMQSLIWM